VKLSDVKKNYVIKFLQNLENGLAYFT